VPEEKEYNPAINPLIKLKMKTNNNLFSFLVKEREYKKKATLFINLDKESYRFMRMIV
jgi:hypothetical protein